MVQSSSALWFLAFLQESVVTETPPVSLQIIQTYPPDPSCGPGEEGSGGGAIVLLTVLLSAKSMHEVLEYFGDQVSPRDPLPPEHRLFLMVIDWDVVTSEPRP